MELNRQLYITLHLRKCSQGIPIGLAYDVFLEGRLNIFLYRRKRANEKDVEGPVQKHRRCGTLDDTA